MNSPPATPQVKPRLSHSGSIRPRPRSSLRRSLSTTECVNSPARPSTPNSVAATISQSSPISSTHAFDKRRSSTLSESAASLRNSTDDLSRPRPKRQELATKHDQSYWQSIPLALALLPAVAGLFFENGSVVITDITLLGLAAIFLNWSVRLPWDWYQSAQTILVQHPDDTEFGHSTIPEEVVRTDKDVPSNSNHSRSPTIDHDSDLSYAQLPKEQPHSSTSSAITRNKSNHNKATHELRIHEILALSTCFIAPLIGAWLLHHIRAQLTRPSEGLVSNYNLTIFIIAAELRPLAHLVKLVQARTFHLQRCVEAADHAARTIDEGTSDISRIDSSSLLSPSVFAELSSRLDAVESHISASHPAINGLAQTLPNQQPQVQHELMPSAQDNVAPDIEALYRALRRSEKRAVEQTFFIESRLDGLESRVRNTVDLVATAKQGSQKNLSSPVFVLPQPLSKHYRAICSIIGTFLSLPVHILRTVFRLPGHIAIFLWSQIEVHSGAYLGREMMNMNTSDHRRGGTRNRDSRSATPMRSSSS